MKQAATILVLASILLGCGARRTEPGPCYTDSECHAADHRAGITEHGYGAGHPGDFPGHAH